MAALPQIQNSLTPSPQLAAAKWAPLTSAFLESPPVKSLNHPAAAAGQLPHSSVGGAIPADTAGQALGGSEATVLPSPSPVTIAAAPQPLVQDTGLTQTQLQGQPKPELGSTAARTARAPYRPLGRSPQQQATPVFITEPQVIEQPSLLPPPQSVFPAESRGYYPAGSFAHGHPPVAPLPLPLPPPLPLPTPSHSQPVRQQSRAVRPFMPPGMRPPVRLQNGLVPVQQAHSQPQQLNSRTRAPQQPQQASLTAAQHAQHALQFLHSDRTSRVQPRASYSVNTGSATPVRQPQNQGTAEVAAQYAQRAAAPVVGSSNTGDMEWQCSICTYLHEGPEARFLNCAVCTEPKG